MESAWVVASDAASRQLSWIWCRGLSEFGSGSVDVSRDSIDNLEWF